ncbi:MAG: hypothetical protein ABSH48_17235 [Verrucomicrobiota bacterium]|jgi:hypothetical protein
MAKLSQLGDMLDLGAPVQPETLPGDTPDLSPVCNPFVTVLSLKDGR